MSNIQMQKDKTYSNNIPALWQNVKREKAVCLRCKKIDSILLEKAALHLGAHRVPLHQKSGRHGRVTRNPEKTNARRSTLCTSAGIAAL